MNLRQAAQQALEALEETATCPKNWPLQYEKEEKAITALRAALAEPEGKAKLITAAEMSAWVKDTWKKCQAEAWQEPVAWLYRDAWGTMKLSQTLPPPVGAFPVYTTPTPRKPLTDEEIGKIAGDTLDPWSCARAIEKAHGIGDQL